LEDYEIRLEAKLHVKEEKRAPEVTLLSKIIFSPLFQFPLHVCY